eukprot:gene640-357_t
MSNTPPDDNGELERVPTAIDDDINDMFDLAAPPLEKPVVARLVPADDTQWEAIVLHMDDQMCVLGRSKELVAPYRIEGVEKLSGRHCALAVDPVTLRITLTDVSTNGTYVNDQRIPKGEAVRLQSGDKVALTKPAATAGANERAVVFLFQRVKAETSASELLASLTCSICQSVYHRPCSVLPCLHVFCAHCISQWIDSGHPTCAECRQKIHSVRPTHKIGSCVEQMLRSSPHLQRPSDELAELERLDTIPAGGRVLRTRRNDSEDDEERGAEEDMSQEEEEDDDTSDQPLRVHAFRSQLAPHVAPAQLRCRQCDSPSAIDGFQCCSANTAADGSNGIMPQHLQCRACWQPFPERPLCDRPQRCFLCLAPYCNMYFAGPDGGCPIQQGDNVLLRPFEEHTVHALPPKTFAGNSVEQTILTTYLSTKHIPMEQMLRDCLHRFADGTWKPDLRTVSGELTPKAPVCRGCAGDIYAALIFHYRRAIPDAELPESVTNRQHCWYGIQCRTQLHNTRHAQNFHHVCYQEKRKE